MKNKKIAHHLDTLAKLMELHNQDKFKIKAIANAAFLVSQLPYNLSDNVEQVATIQGIGKSTAALITELLQHNRLQKLEEYLQSTPPGILQMLTIKGIGIAKIKTIWKELAIDTVEELLVACQQNKLLPLKGMGQKTQSNIEQAVIYYLSNKDAVLYAQVAEWATALLQQLQQDYPNYIFQLTGDYVQQNEIVRELEIVTNMPEKALMNLSTVYATTLLTTSETKVEMQWEQQFKVVFYIEETPLGIFQKTFKKSSTSAFYEAFTAKYALSNATNEVMLFEQHQLSFIPAYLRHDAKNITLAEKNQLPKPIDIADIKGLIHCHSTWSDGLNSIKEMALAAQKAGMLYMLVTDHSQSAFYANGLKPHQVVAQHQEIDQLNKELFPFKIFKGIESDILNNGALDYEQDILHSFDVVIASVHSNLKMDEPTANKRLITAIENPYTSILGHMTGRLLLQREGYPINHQLIIDACAANNVAIELNANPRRLDMDWRWIDYALSKGVFISINPDAHTIDGINDIAYGIKVAQKAGLLKENNISSYELEKFEDYIKKIKR